MKLKKDFLKRIEFENRIFFSFGIVILVVVCSYTFFRNFPRTSEIPFLLFGIDAKYSSHFGYSAAVAAVLFGSLIRMWAGSILTSSRMMSFKVKPEKLITCGPYSIVRNPIYLADMIALSGLTFILPASGLLMPLLFFLHYQRIIQYEEDNLLRSVKSDYNKYFQNVPRLLPDFRHKGNYHLNAGDFKINYDGFRHNALYIFFIPGLIISAVTDNVIYTFLIGIPAVAEWGYIHTKIGFNKLSSQKNIPERTKFKTPVRNKIFDSIIYAQCWEDVSLDREAFNINKNDVVFTITSGGCNALAFLPDDPEKVIALDLNEKQNFLLELKMAAFKCLTYSELLEFVGVRESDNRNHLYKIIKNNLSPDALHYWNNNLNLIRKGIIHAGRYENYLKLLRIVFQFILGKELINKMFSVEDAVERLQLYETKWNNYKWKIFIRVFLSRRLMTFLFDKAFFRYIKYDFSFGLNFEKKVKYAISMPDIKANFFLSYILLGRYYSEDYLPYYLRKENFEVIRQRLDRIEIITQSCGDYFSSIEDSTISKFNFTNIFEWMSDMEFEKLLKETVRVARNHSIITYRNLLVQRIHPGTLDENIKTLKEISECLHAKDFSFIYDRYIVEEIEKEYDK